LILLPTAERRKAAKSTLFSEDHLQRDGLTGGGRIANKPFSISVSRMKKIEYFRRLSVIR
jgi:hypothetical protein